MWERAKESSGPWEPVNQSRVPAHVARRYDAWTARNGVPMPSHRYYYRRVAVLSEPPSGSLHSEGL